MKQHHVAEHLEKGKEIGKEYTAKSWNFMKGMYANVAGQVETVARDNGYKVDLGEHALLRILSLHVVLYGNSTTGVKAIIRMHTGPDRPMFRAGGIKYADADRFRTAIVQSSKHHVCRVLLQIVARSLVSKSMLQLQLMQALSKDRKLQHASHTGPSKHKVTNARMTLHMDGSGHYIACFVTDLFVMEGTDVCSRRNKITIYTQST